jgi:hypothetical protein
MEIVGYLVMTLAGLVASVLIALWVGPRLAARAVDEAVCRMAARIWLEQIVDEEPRPFDLPPEKFVVVMDDGGQLMTIHLWEN